MGQEASNPEPREDWGYRLAGVVSTQSALLAGFAFVGLAAVPKTPSPPLTTAFAAAVSCSVASELLALFLFSLLRWAHEIDLRPGFKWVARIAWGAYLSGFVAFSLALALLIWMQLGESELARLITVVFAGLAFIVGLAGISRISWAWLH